MTRMWMVDPQIMCRQHLLGEHKELHQFVGTIKKGIGITGYVNNGLIEPQAITQRHQELTKEMIRRGYTHKSPIETKTMIRNMLKGYPIHQQVAKVNTLDSLFELLERCPECKHQYENR